MLSLSALMLPLCIVQMRYMPRARGIFISPNFLGGYAALNIFLALIARSRLGASVNLIMLLLSQSRGAILATAISSLVVVCPLTPKPRWPALAGLLGVTTAIVGTISYARGWPLLDEPRLGIWRLALQVGMHRPLLGWGQYGITLGFNQATNFYSIPIEWFVYTGIVGIAAGAWMLAEAIRASDRTSLAFLICWFVNGLTMGARPETSIALFTVLGLFASERRDVARRAVVINDHKPFLDSRVRAAGTD